MGNEDLPQTVEQLRGKPITETSMGSVRLRRALVKAGLKTVGELIDCPDSVIDDLMRSRVLSIQEADEIDGIRHRYHKDPKGFWRHLVSEDGTVSPATASADDVIRRVGSAPNRASRTGGSRERRRSSGLLPSAVEPLLSYEDRARRSFDALAERGDTYLVFEAFDDFPTELGSIQDGFVEYFGRYRRNTRIALEDIEHYLPNLFLIFVADQAQQLFDGKNLWEQLFDRLGIVDQNVGNVFKGLFVKLLEKRRMPTYGKDEQTFYYLYTAVLHGGLSRTIWATLWKDSFQPLCRDFSRGRARFNGLLDGRTSLQEMRIPDGRYTPNKAAVSILSKAPDNTLAPLFDAAINVTWQVLGYAGGSLPLVSSYGLPDTAMEALRDVLSERQGAQGGGVARAKEGAQRSFFYLPLGRLVLDLGQGGLYITWKRHRMPIDLVDYGVDFYVDGELVHSVAIKESVGIALMDSVSLSVAPKQRLDVEIRLMAPPADAEEMDYSETGSLSQHFKGLKPHCLEFLKTRDGTYELRSPRERIGRARRIAYLLPASLRIVPGKGMRIVEVRSLNSSQTDGSIAVADVFPGASGSLVDARTGQVLSEWQESFTVVVDGPHRIGKTREGVDVYGVTRYRGAFNLSMPTVTIEAQDGEAALSDLDVSLICDGKRVSVGRRLLWGSSEDDAARVRLLLDEALGLDRMLSDCLLVCRSSGTVVLRYRFAVAPMADCALRELSLRDASLVVSYGFTATQQVSVVLREASRLLREGEEFTFTEGADASETSVRLSSAQGAGGMIEFRLWLLGTEFRLPRRLMERAADHPICMADVLGIGAGRAAMVVTAHERRPGRRLLVLLEEVPIAYRDLEGPGVHSIDLLSEYGAFLQHGAEAESLKLIVSVSFGESFSRGVVFAPVWRDVVIADCVQGFGFSAYETYVDRDGARHLRFDAPARCKLRCEFIRGDSGRILDTIILPLHGQDMVLPRTVSRQISTKRPIGLVITPLSRFGKPLDQYQERLGLSL